MRLAASASRAGVVFLTAAYGVGHLQACRALENGLRAGQTGWLPREIWLSRQEVLSSRNSSFDV